MQEKINSSSQREKVSYDITYMWNLNNDTTELLCELERDWQNRLGVRCKFLHIDWMDKVPLYSTGNLWFCPRTLTITEKNIYINIKKNYVCMCVCIYIYLYICITESLCCTTEINISQLYFNNLKNWPEKRKTWSRTITRGEVFFKIKNLP